MDVREFLSGTLEYDAPTGLICSQHEKGRDRVCSVFGHDALVFKQISKLKKEGKVLTEASRREINKEGYQLKDDLGKFILEAIQEKLARESQSLQFAGTAEGDWEGLYVDGELKTEGHSVSVGEVLEVLNVHVDKPLELSEEEIEHFGYSLPDTLEEIHAYRKKSE